MHVGFSTPFYNDIFVAWALQTPANINMHDEAIRMERSCLVVVQHKHSIAGEIEQLARSLRVDSA